jgi:hypothetical protein
VDFAKSAYQLAGLAGFELSSPNGWTGGRVAEGAPLLREYTLRAYRGFESLLHRQIASFLGGFFVIYKKIGITNC